jgi:type I restriction enzyme S subunit
MITAVDCTIIRFDRAKIIPEYFKYFSQSFAYFLDVERACTGATRKRISRKNLGDIELPLPPLAEQKRIVAILDEAFEGIAAAVTNAEKNLANARELFESYLNSVLTFEDEGAEARRLATLCDHNRIITYGVIKLGEEVTDGVPCLRTSNVRWLDIETDGMKHIAASLSNDYKRTILQGGEVLVNVRGTLGGVAVAKPEMVGWNVSREVAVVPTDTKKVNSFYLAYWIARKASQAWLTGVQKGVAYTGINIADLRELPVAVPNMDKQIEVVAQLDSLSEESCRLEAIYQQKLDSLAELKQAVLQKAFAGELTAQPEEFLQEAVA